MRDISRYLWILLVSIGVFSFSFEKVSAAITYTRNPPGSSPTSPITITVSVAAFSDYGLPESTLVYRLSLDTDFEGTPIGKCYPVSTLSISQTFILSGGNAIKGIGIDGAVGSADPNDCDTGTTGFKYLEGDGIGVAFTVQGPPAPTTGPQQFRPGIVIEKPKEGGALGFKGEIKYKATDENNTRGIAPDRFGLISKPVSLFYSDTIDELLGGRLIAEEDKKLIQKDLDAEGIFIWDTKNLPEGDNYRIIANARDLFDDVGEFVTGPFSIDHTPPTFTVRADPAVSRGENVKIIVEPSEELSESPQVFVTQRNYTKIQVFVRRAEKNWEGTYEVRSGFDGPAEATVSGKDLAGNVGDLVVGGRTFSVGVEPPPKPLILAPIDKDVLIADIVTLKGKAREDTEVVLLVNGKDEYKTKPDKDGNFVFPATGGSAFGGENIKLSAEASRGINTLSVTAHDTAGNISEAAVITVKFNLSPEIKVLSPKKDEAVSASTTIKVSAVDKNNDKLVFTYELSPDVAVGAGGERWTTLGEKITSRQFSFRTNEFPDGKYIIRVIADDGFTKVEARSDVFNINNFLPAISFTDGPRTISNKKDVVIAGKIQSPSTAATRYNIAIAEYSLDGGPSAGEAGKTWLVLRANDGAFDSFEENFTLSMLDLKEGLYTILFRARDSRRFFGRATKTVIVDFGPPGVPSIQQPAPSVQLSVISNSADLDPNVAGVQFEISGKSEANATLTAVLKDQSFGAKADENGNFRIVVTLREHGRNDFRIFATDLAGNKSPEALLSVIYNNPPDLKFLSPREGRGLNHFATVRWEASDRDGDVISGLKLSYRKGNAAFKLLTRLPDGQASNLKLLKFEWNVSDFPDGADYELRLEATDGISSSVVTRQFYIDNTPPQITLEPLAKTTFNKSFTLEARGEASDNFSGVEFVEYTIDSEHWFKAVISQGFLTKKAVFRVRHPFRLEDGVYDFKVRAVDAAGNLSVPASQKIVVDTTPPRIGSFTISSGPLSILPASSAGGPASSAGGPEGGIFRILIDTKLILRISMEADTVKSEIRSTKSETNSKSQPLIKNKSTGLWETELIFGQLGPPRLGEAGRLTMVVSAEDALGNKLKDKKIGEIEVLRRGKTEPEAKITVFIKQPEAGFVKWQAEEYGFSNPVLAEDSGEYQLLLPAGQYQILVQKLGFERLRTSEFEILNPQFINFDFALTPRKGIRGAIEDLLERLSF